MKAAEVLTLLDQNRPTTALRAAWDDFALEFGVDLPHEYKSLIDKGEPIELFSFFFLVNPFAEDGSFPRENNPMIDFVRETANCLDSEIDLIEFGGITFDEDNILNTIFPIGGTENSDEVWLVRTKQDWRVVVSNRHYTEVEVFEMGLSEFLRKFILGEVCPRCFPEVVLRRQGWPLMVR